MIYRTRTWIGKETCCARSTCIITFICLRICRCQYWYSHCCRCCCFCMQNKIENTCQYTLLSNYLHQDSIFFFHQHMRYYFVECSRFLSHPKAFHFYTNELNVCHHSKHETYGNHLGQQRNHPLYLKINRFSFCLKQQSYSQSTVAKRASLGHKKHFICFLFICI